MVIDNFEQVTELLFSRLDEVNASDEFNEDDKVLIGSVIRRTKENPDKKTYVVKRYCFKSKKEFLELREEIKEYCHMFNARFYLATNIKSLQSIAFDMSIEMPKIIKNKEFNYARRLWDSVSDSNTGLRPEQLWIVDIDEQDEEFIKELTHTINNHPRSKEGQATVVATIKTLNGVHLLTTPHDIRYLEKHPRRAEFDIKKNAKTVVYYGGTDDK